MQTKCQTLQLSTIIRVKEKGWFFEISTEKKRKKRGVGVGVGVESLPKIRTCKFNLVTNFIYYMLTVPIVSKQLNMLKRGIK